MFDKRKDSDNAVSPTTETATPPATVASSRFAEPVSRASAVIGSTITIAGDVSGEENLIIEGRVEGSVNLNHNDLTVGQNGYVKANVTADTVRIDGEVVGDIAGVEKVIVTKTGKVNGNIVAPRVTLEDGAKFKGSIDMDPSERPSEVKPAPLKSATKATTGSEDSKVDSASASG